jgi:hypothetical protein
MPSVVLATWQRQASAAHTGRRGLAQERPRFLQELHHLADDRSLFAAAAPGDSRFVVFGNVQPLQGTAARGQWLVACREAGTMCARWKEAVGRLSFGEMLADVCQFLALSSQENALKYFAFWSTAVLGLRQAPAA